MWVSANLTAAQAPLECPMMIVFSSTPNSSFMKGSQMELKTGTITILLSSFSFKPPSSDRVGHVFQTTGEPWDLIQPVGSPAIPEHLQEYGFSIFFLQNPKARDISFQFHTS